MRTDAQPAVASAQAAGGNMSPAALSVDMSAATKLLPALLSVIAGSVDTIGFLCLGGLFIAHITGNLVILAARVVAGQPAPVAHVISVPMFLVALLLTRLSAGGLDRLRIPSLTPLLLVQFLLLSAFLVLARPPVDPQAPRMILAAMLGVSAMAVQNALVRISLTDAPSTAVMTTNITVFTIDIGDILLARDPARVARALWRIRHAWPAICGFLLGCALGGAAEASMGPRSLVLPAALALVAVALGMAGHLQRAATSPSTPKERAP